MRVIHVKDQDRRNRKSSILVPKKYVTTCISIDSINFDR